MTLLYRSDLIESAEQAEALPVGSILHVPRGRWSSGLTGSVVRSPHHNDTIFRVGVDRWPVQRVLDVFVEALVPIEAEEVRVITSGGLERDYNGATVLNHTPDGPRRDYRRTEFHTPWEEA